MGAEGDLVAQRLGRGCRCYVVWREGAVGGYGWLSTTPEWIGEIELQITPGPGEGYIWNCVTMPEHRRQGIFRSLLLGIQHAARREGLRRLWIGSVAIPAERAVGPAGFRPALRFQTVTVAGIRVLRVTEDVDSGLAAAARAALATRPGLHIRRRSARRH
jgi:GNAT superfamily N-acetyltransferase